MKPKYKAPPALVKLVKEHATQIEFAIESGINQGHISSLLSGQKKITLGIAERIEQYTKGRITAQSLLFPRK